MNAVITVVGKDKVGIMAGVCITLQKVNVNILDISQTVLHNDIFTMNMLRCPFDSVHCRRIRMTNRVTAASNTKTT